MNLTAYSDSESDSEAPSIKRASAPTLPKLATPKVVNRAESGRIKINLPGASQTRLSRDDIEGEAPPAKKPRLTGGAFGGFNAMLPAPKKPIITPSTTADATTTKRSLGKALAVGVNLKTSTEPAFKRESRVEFDDYDENGDPIQKLSRNNLNQDEFRAMLNLPPPKSETKSRSMSEIPVIPSSTRLTEAAKPAAPRFVPMSIGKGKKGKKPIATRSNFATTQTVEASTVSELPLAQKQKISLFGDSELAPAIAVAASSEPYQPLLYEAEKNMDTEESIQAHGSYQAACDTPGSTDDPNDLTSIASELNLSKAERRQLLGNKGRGRPDVSSAKIIEFNTDTEYAHNEMLRQQGEQMQHNPLKSITGTGKNSLRSLVTQATSQKEALEDHFASGYRNKKEAGNRYGW